VATVAVAVAMAATVVATKAMVLEGVRIHFKMCAYYQKYLK
jgi:hypothetical protein